MTSVEAIRIVFGIPATDAAVSKMERWLNSHCRDWRRSDAGSEVAADLILTAPMEPKSFRPLMAMHVKNWGFTRKRYARSNYTLMTVEEFERGPEGEIAKSLKQQVEAYMADQKARKHAEKIKPGLERLASLLDKKTKPVLREAAKKLWNLAHSRLNQQAWDQNPDYKFAHVPAKRRRLTKADFSRKDNYRPEDGEYIVRDP